MKTDNEINIELNNDVALGSYSNLAIITHSSSEFIFDFISMLPGIPKPQVTNRIIMTAEHAKRLMLALEDNIAKYENQYGEIVLNNEQKNMFPMGFGGNSAKA
ncbi:hypothetical protein SDC9_172961 [bioreactor metagenome]|uniref:DUF3467 domain-containing protein n=1 Tax=bioreactor metagenome TaxID=1076179 RepID=A0A645GID6_9ZZZZ|nr:DUF3467 domain-containing protein [Rikenellaceae bacterium]